jgi:hypothetical protein
MPGRSTPPDGFTCPGFFFRPQQQQQQQVALNSDVLRAHPTVVSAVDELGCGETKYRLDRPAQLLPAAARGDWLNSDSLEDVKRLGYDIVLGPPSTANNSFFRRAQVRGFRVLWVLGDTDALGAVAGSHKCSLPPPPSDIAAEMNALVPLPLRAGDLLIAAATTLLAWLPNGATGAVAATAPPRIVELVLVLDHKIGGVPQLQSTGPKTTSLEQNLTNDQWVFADDRYLIVRRLQTYQLSTRFCTHICTHTPH